MCLVILRVKMLSEQLRKVSGSGYSFANRLSPAERKRIYRRLLVIQTTETANHLGGNAMNGKIDFVNASLWKTVAILVTLLVAVVTFAFTNISLSGDMDFLKGEITTNDKRISVNEERILRISQDINDIKENQKEMLRLLQENNRRNR